MSVGAVNKQTGDRIPTAGMPAIDNALSAISTNPVQNAIITAALANKQEATDNNLDTEAKNIVGAINEHENDIDSLKSGLTNYETQNNINLEVPDRKNVLKNTANSATASGVLYTVNNDGSVSLSTETQSSNISSLLINDFTLPAGKYVLNGCPSGGSSSTYELQIAIGGSTYRDYGDGISFTSTNQRCVVQILIRSGVTINDTFYPMIRPATITDSTFAPYIPSVESRIEAVESGLTSIFLPTSRLTAVNDLDGVIKPGAYYFRDADNPANAPASNCYIAVIRQYDNSSRIAQIAYSFSVNTIYVRKTLDWGSTWGDWYSLDNTQITQ